MDTLANTLHDNIAWQFKEMTQHFTSALAELKTWDPHHGYTRITLKLMESSTTIDHNTNNGNKA